MTRLLTCLFLILVPEIAAAQTNNTVTSDPGRRSAAPELILRSAEAVNLCLRADANWQNFCNGLVQAYAEYANLSGKACIPPDTERRDLVAIFTAPEVVVSTGYIDNWPAMDTAVEMFIKAFPCE